ncbi:lycopene cyclase family protein [Penaeicola halotolerans]|uniref:lycopene cyclase family protein n=1 Tax=Penaeicola halotolerans TaxID=2793196 RepID=UPI001CF82292|nr:lycopene cyclase family protein [Penaeicola halotolerans]
MNYDYILTGAGCAGLSFIHYLLRSSLKDKNVLIIDDSPKNANDKTWCYWSDEILSIHPNQDQIVSWNQVTVSDQIQEVQKPLAHYTYYHVKAIDLYDQVMTEINQSDNITYLTDRVVKTAFIDKGYIVTTENSGVYTGAYIINSIPQFSPHASATKAIKQVFVGWRIKTDQALVNQNSATLMKFDHLTQDQVNFFYILPFSPNELLVEYTLFTKESLNESMMRDKLKTYLSEHMGIDQFEIIHEEKGSIPMTTRASYQAQKQNWVDIGTAGGCTKPSTGYTFYNIQKQVQRLINELESNKTLTTNWKRKSRFIFYDNILLNIIDKWPKQMAAIFRSMFQNNHPDQVFKFLQEETSFWEELKILSKLPFKYFLKSLVQYEKH